MTALTGRALDLACATALGWTLEVGTGWWFPPKPDAYDSGRAELWVPKYSEDAATQPEMLAWLRQRGCLLEMFEIPEGDDDELVVWRVQGWIRSCSDSSLDVRGETLNQAIARLVVAVAAAREAKP